MTTKVLWVRSSTDIEKPLERSLAQRGFRLVPVDSPAELASYTKNNDTFALIADARHLVDASRQLPKGAAKPIPLLVIGGQNELGAHLEALRRGADAFFPSPLDTDALAEKLEDLRTRSGSAETYRVMVVDDDPSQVEFAAAILRKAGIEVCTVTESLDVLRTLHACKPDLILMDVYMPDASGVELTTVIREQKAYMDIPIVYLSAEQDPDKQLDALSVGGEDFLTKPIRPKHLLATVRNRIERSKQLRQRAEARQTEGRDPAEVRRQILEQLGRTRASAAGKHTALMYLEIDTPILFLERLNLDGIDHLMSAIGGVARGLTRIGDQVNRFGDFCLVIIAQRDSRQGLLDLAQRLRRTVAAERFQVSGLTVSTGLTIGVRFIEHGDEDVSRLINDAIQACHQARETEAHGVGLHESAPVEHASPEGPDAQVLDRVMDPDNLQILYQPIVPLQREPESLYQCLLRLRARNGSLLSAGEFLPAVEQTGKILKLDRWVILKAVVLLRKLRGKGGKPNLRLFVSQSPSALKDAQRVQWINESLKKLGITGEGLVLEFRFPEIAMDQNLARGYFESLHQGGIGVSLNCTRDLDALARALVTLPFDYVKVTENQIRSNPDAWGRLVDTVHDKGKRVIVSRIEHPELLAQLWAKQVDYIQGHFVQHPGEDLDFDFSGAVLG